ncbi:hypothetical protein ACFQU7_06565 [Pseudoroseomonas wenyumeiae]
MTTIALPGEGQGSRYRILGWGASALLHGGALAFFLYGLPQATMPPPAPEIIPLEMAAALRRRRWKPPNPRRQWRRRRLWRRSQPRPPRCLRRPWP